jgi:hypothetical protein
LTVAWPMPRLAPVNSITRRLWFDWSDDKDAASEV